MSDQPTPMMAQYLDIKSNYEDALLFYRMGDFYELFFDDAKVAADVLDITLTHRGKHLGQEIPMCGVPVHSHESYLHRLIRTGRHVAICEQTEDPAEAKKRGSKSVVRREVVRLVTPGTLTEENLLDNRSHNYLAAYVVIRDEAALAWADISTGEFFVSTVMGDIEPHLAAITPNELIIPDGTDITQLNEVVGYVTPIARASFDVASATDRLTKFYGVASLDVYGAFTRAQVAAMGGIVDYLSLTQLETHAQLQPPQLVSAADAVEIDAATRRNLEMVQALSGGRAGSILDAIDATITAIGGRRFEDRLKSPTTDTHAINARLALIDALSDLPNWQDIREHLRATPDFERAYRRLALGRGSPRDLRVLGDGIVAANAIAALIPSSVDTSVEAHRASLGSLDDLARDIRNVLVETPPVVTRDGGFVADGVYPELDELRALRADTRSIMAQTQARYVELSGITALKIKFNNVLGYFIEVPASHSKHMLGEEMAETFIHRQTTANAVRFTTTELSELQSKILGATEAAVAFEKRVFDEWITRILPLSMQVAAIADSVGEIDIVATMAGHIARGWTRPEITDGMDFDIEGGRHPVVERSLAVEGRDFIANDGNLGQGQFLWLVTGPNMAGKSTYLRQNAIIAILAQCGFYVPATRAKIGVVDKVFSRIGAADDLARGRSTFMVEMIETAAILNQATDCSLVILDEIGRGTATYDGLAIAWATLEYLLSSVKCRGLFATHFHELTALERQYDGLYPAHIAVREWQNQIVFLHEIQRGAAERSYGVDVAKLAGLPPAVVERARTLLAELENEDKAKDLGELPLFQATPPTPTLQTKPSEALAELREINPDFMTPREALDALYALVDKARQEN